MEILHIDMDAFFASVEQLDHPEWRGKPLIVGAGPHERGVVSTCSYEARAYSIHSAMPSRTAYAKCPHAIFTPPRMARYAEISEKAFEIFGRFSPFVEAVSIDEAFLDITGSSHLFGGRRALAERLRATIRDELGITCSAGIAPNRLLAKIASEINKPDGLFETPFDEAEILEFLAPMKAGAIWGVGKKTAELLASRGYITCGDLQKADPRHLESLLGRAAAASILAHARGIDPSSVRSGGEPAKSVSREYTFPEDVSDRSEARAQLVDLVAEVGRQFREERRWAQTAKLKLRYADFRTISRQRKFPLPSRDDTSLREAALALFDEAWPERGAGDGAIRLIGFGVCDFTADAGTGKSDLFGVDPAVVRREKRERLSEALDRLKSPLRALRPAADPPRG